MSVCSSHEVGETGIAGPVSKGFRAQVLLSRWPRLARRGRMPAATAAAGPEAGQQRQGSLPEVGEGGPGSADEPDEAAGAAATPEGDRSNHHDRPVHLSEAGPDPEAGRRADHQDAAPHPGHPGRRSAEARLSGSASPSSTPRSSASTSRARTPSTRRSSTRRPPRRPRCRTSRRATRRCSRSGCSRRSRPTSRHQVQASTSAWTRSCSSSPTCSRR